MSVVEALERELAGRPAFVRESTSAAQARVMAEVLDEPGVSAAQKSLCNRELRKTLDGLRALAAARTDGDGIDELDARRNARRAAVAP